MRQRLPSLTRHRLGWTPWRFLRSANTHGTTGAWTSAVNTGTGVEPGYHQAIEHLKVFGAGLGNIPANQIERIKTDYATVEPADAANLHRMEVIGSREGS